MNLIYLESKPSFYTKILRYLIMNEVDFLERRDNTFFILSERNSKDIELNIQKFVSLYNNKNETFTDKLLLVSLLANKYTKERFNELKNTFTKFQIFEKNVK